MSRSASVAGRSVGTPTGGSPIQCASPSRSVRVARLRGARRSSSATRRRRARRTRAGRCPAGRRRACGRRRPGSRRRPCSRRTTGMTRRSRASTAEDVEAWARSGRSARSGVLRGGDAGLTRSASGSPTTAPRSSASKQVRSPVWQAAPTWSTRTSRASPSQSRATDRTCWTWPEVSPLRQYSPRLRDQNVTRPSVRVRRSASSSIQPSMSTSPVSCCWTTAATRPAASRLSRAAIAGSRTASGVAGVGTRSLCRGPGRRRRGGRPTDGSGRHPVVEPGQHRGEGEEQDGHTEARHGDRPGTLGADVEERVGVPAGGRTDDEGPRQPGDRPGQGQQGVAPRGAWARPGQQPARRSRSPARPCAAACRRPSSPRRGAAAAGAG